MCFFWDVRSNEHNALMKEEYIMSCIYNLVELKVKLRALEQEKEVWRFVFDVVEDEYGEEVVKKYMPEAIM